MRWCLRKTGMRLTPNLLCRLTVELKVCRRCRTKLKKGDLKSWVIDFNFTRIMIRNGFIRQWRSRKNLWLKKNKCRKMQTNIETTGKKTFTKENLSIKSSWKCLPEGITLSSTITLFKALSRINLSTNQNWISCSRKEKATFKVSEKLKA